MDYGLVVWKRGELFFIDLVGNGEKVEVFRSKSKSETRHKLNALKTILGCNVLLEGVDV